MGGCLWFAVPPIGSYFCDDDWIAVIACMCAAFGSVLQEKDIQGAFSVSDMVGTVQLVPVVYRCTGITKGDNRRLFLLCART